MDFKEYKNSSYQVGRRAHIMSNVKAAGQHFEPLWMFPYLYDRCMVIAWEVFLFWAVILMFDLFEIPCLSW